MSDKLKIIIAYTAICTIWGSTWLVIKIGLETLTPLLAAGLRFALAGVILFGIIQFKKIVVPWDENTRWFYFVIALTSFSLPFGLVYWGEHQISSGLTSILFGMYPLCVALISSIMIKTDRVTFLKVLGVLLGFGGVVTIFSNDVQFSGNPDALLGMGAVVMSAVIQAFSAVTIKKHGHDISPFVVSFVPMSISAVLLLGASVSVEDYSIVQFTPMALFSIFFLAIFGTIVTFVSYFWLLKRVEVVLLSLTAFVTPLIAVLLGVLLLNEKVSAELFAGAFLVFTGIATANAKEIRVFVRNKFLEKK
ncbi:MAG: EamA family transporter [Bacteroidota bacterium]|nr:EamA family transporter [Bacteroidota bacterium]